MARHGVAAVVGCVLLVGVGLVLVATAFGQPGAVFTAASGPAIDPATRPALARFLAANTVVVGKVMSVEADVTDAGNGVKYSIANVKIDDGLLGTKNVTHLKVGFVPNQRGTELASGGQYLLFLTKHPSEGFQVIPPMALPIPATDEAKYKKAVAEVEKAAAAVKDPMTTLKADKAADRGHAAVVLLSLYRTPPAGVVRLMDNEDLPADESKLLLDALAEADWATETHGISGFSAFRGLNLTAKDGWTPPGVKPGVSVFDEYKKGFAAWRSTAAGKEYRVKKLVPKK
jgi:hypothetical protein